jgi:hypothetical protein
MAETGANRNPGAALSSYDRPGMMTRSLAVLALVACASGCFGYNKSAKRWAYAGNTVLILAGGAAIAGDILTKSESEPVMPGEPEAYEPPISGGIVAGALLVGAGIFGIIFNATRPDVKTSR